jgi:anti-sigma regulatory factor (Ser/Thr protein kinase)
MFLPLPNGSGDDLVLRWRRSFEGCADQARAVRLLVAALLHGCQFLDDVLLAVDELVVNALRHTLSGAPGGSFCVEVRRWSDSKDGDLVAIGVFDQGGPHDPVAVEADELAESGRGLRTVSLTAESWGWFGNSDGRTVVAVFAEADLARCAAA